MKMKMLAVLAACLTMGSFGLAYAQGQQDMAAPQSEQTAQEESQTQWQYIEVTGIDLAKNALSGKYIDYDTDAEKEMTILVDKDTVFENAKSLAEIKVQDTAGVDYLVTADGKNLAKNISVEKSEAAPAPAAQAQPQGAAAVAPPQDAQQQSQVSGSAQ
jgi:N-acetylmuramoyl-L-alanine amidase CwlA